MKQKLAPRGFTIVELLIVVVIIAILAVVTIVAFNGIQRRASQSASATAAGSVVKKAEIYKEINGGYPTSLAQLGIASNDKTTLEYTATATTFCATATTNNISMYASQDKTAPIRGSCAGHGVDGVAAVTNYATDPSFEMNSLSNMNYGGYNGSYSTAQKHSGTRSYVINGAATPADAYIDFFVDIPVATPTLTVSMKVFITAAGTPYSGRYTWLYCGGGGCTEKTPNPTYNLTTLNQWQTISRTFSFASTGKVRVRLYGLTSSGVYFDSLMVTDGSGAVYKDGDSTGWARNGAANASISRGADG